MKPTSTTRRYALGDEFDMFVSLHTGDGGGLLSMTIEMYDKAETVSAKSLDEAMAVFAEAVKAWKKGKRA